MSAFKLQNINTVNFTDNNGAGGVSMIHITGGVSVDGVIVATTGVSAGTLRLASGSITDTSSSITFGTNILSTTGGVSFKGGVSLNGYTYPTSLGVSQFLFYNGDETGVSGIKIVSPDSSIDIQYAPGLLAIAATGGGGGGGGGGTSINGLTDAAADGVVGNIFLGYKPPNINIPAANNIAIGVSAIFSKGVELISCSNNIAVGSNALLLANADTTNDNIAIGYSTLISTDANSSQNVAIGTSALTAATGTSQNVAVGYIAGQEITTGYQNTIVGASAGITLTTGNNNSVIGFEAQSSSATISDEFTLGNGNILNLRCADQFIASLSDARDKTDVEDSRFGINFLDNVRPVEFTWQRRNLTPGDENNNKNGKRRVGFIAQELQEAMSDGENDILDLVYESNHDRLEAKYGNLIPVLVKAVKDLKAEVDTLKQRMDACSC